MSDVSMRIDPIELPGASDELQAQLAATAELIREHSSFAVAAHAGPDGDAVGSTLGLMIVLEEMNKQVVAFNRDRVPYTYRFLPRVERITNNLKHIPRDVDVFFVLDCSSLDRVDPDLKIDVSRTKVVVIDHHATVDTSTADQFVHDVEASAVGELIYRLLGTLGHSMSTEVASCLFTSVQTDTGSFRYSNTTPAALQVASETVRAGIDVWSASSAVYENHPAGRVHLLAMVLDTLQITPCGRLAFLTVTRDMYRRTGTGSEMLDGFINHARGIHGVEVATQMREVKNDEYRVSFRSRGQVNVAEAATSFGGGGHHNAAGCTVRGTADEVRLKITAELNRLLDDS